MLRDDCSSAGYTAKLRESRNPKGEEKSTVEASLDMRGRLPDNERAAGV